MKEHNAKAYLVNTGWNGTGKRISLKNTRAIIDAILDGSIDKAEKQTVPFLNLTFPEKLEKVDDILDPRTTYKEVADWEKKAKNLTILYNKNFEQYCVTAEGKKLVAAGPSL
jgi:phosphoenolpyruvate carboxykinase (ATP)